MGQGTEASAKVWFPVTTWVWRRLISRRACQLYLWGLVIVVVASTILYVFITPPRRNLDRFLKQVATVELGKTKLDDWRKQVERDRISNVSLYYNQGVWVVEWRGEDNFLRRLRLAPRTVVSASVGFKEGVASEIYVIIEVGYGEVESLEDIVVVVRQSMDNASACDPHYHVARKYGEQVGVGMGPCVNPQERARAFAINTSCLTRIGGCKTVESILPQVFAHP